MIPELLLSWSPSEVTRPYWDAAAAGRLCIQHCESCGALQHPPRAVCTACGGASELGWKQVSGHGVISSLTVVYRPLLPALASEIPYVLAVVALPEGPRMISAVRGPNSDRLSIGAQVEVAFHVVSPDIVLPVFRPVQQARVPGDGE